MTNKTWVEISQTALTENIRSLRATLDPAVSFCAVVKANAYGHGIREVSRIAYGEGVRLFGVDSVDEALTVRSIAPQATIFVMGDTVPERLPDVIRARCVQTIFDVSSVRALAEAARAVGLPALATLEVETGLHRLGAAGKGLMDTFAELKKYAGLVYVTSIASHLSSAEDASRSSITKLQYDKFLQISKEAFQKGFVPEHYHIGCSAAGIMHELPHGTCLRFGIVMYGLWPSSDVKRAGTLGKRHAEIKPALSLKTRLAQVKDLEPGNGVGYGPAFVANRRMRVAVLPIGYYDGLDRRSFSKSGSVIINGTRCPVVGNVCMNMLMVDVSYAPGSLGQNTVVTIIGRDGMHNITAEDLANDRGTINYEVVTAINPLLPRIIV